MAKIKTSYFCQNCGYNSPKWLGRCPNCNEWNTMVEEVIASGRDSDSREILLGSLKKTTSKPRLLSEIDKAEKYRIITEDQEFDRVLGGGLVPGSLILIGGDPGIGKSTLMLQLALSMSDYNILYISGEESEQQFKFRADRLPLL